MTTIRTLAVHEIVDHIYPRPPRSEADELAIAVGRAIDGTQAALSHAQRQGRRLSAAKIDGLADGILREGLEEAGVALEAAALAAELARVRRAVQAFRRSEVFGLGRPRSRLILINGTVGIYAQPDFWDGRGRVYEMKSFRTEPLPPSVGLQLRYFQLAFPTFEAVLVGIDRRADPVTTTSRVIPPPSAPEREVALATAWHLGQEQGRSKVLEYIDEPKTHYETELRAEPLPRGSPPPEPSTTLDAPTAPSEPGPRSGPGA